MLTGVLAGLGAGLFGIGGGAILVPLSLVIFTQVLSPAMSISDAMLVAVATSLASIPFTGAAAVYKHYRLQSLDLHLVKRFAPGFILGGALGGYIAPYIGGDVLKKAFGIFQIIMAWHLYFSNKPSQATNINTQISFGLIQGSSMGTCIGFIAALFGIGGGTLTVPYLLSRGVVVTRAVAVSSASGVCMAVVASFVFGFAKDIHINEYTIGYIYWPGLVGILMTSIICSQKGVLLAHRLPVHLFKKIFAVFLLMVGLKLLF